MIAKEMIQDYSIREVCVDCKHLYESYEYDYEFDEEVHYFLCDKKECVRCHFDPDLEHYCDKKVIGTNDVFDEKENKKWEEETIQKIKQFYKRSICPYCEHTCHYSFTEERYKQEINDVLSEIKHGTCILKIE